MIRWQDLEDSRQSRSYAVIICLSCGKTMFRRQPENTYHRTRAEAQAGAQPLRNCPKCGTALYSRNRIN